MIEPKQYLKLQSNAEAQARALYEMVTVNKPNDRYIAPAWDILPPKIKQRWLDLVAFIDQVIEEVY